MELAVRSRRTIRKSCKLSDYVFPTVAPRQSMVAIHNDEQSESTKSKLRPEAQITQENHNSPTKKSDSWQLKTLHNDADELQQQQNVEKMASLSMASIQLDLNSPLANVRLRALKTIRNPPKSAHGQMDVSQDEESVNAADAHQYAANTPPSMREIFKDIVVYVEVRTDDDDRSAGVKKVIAALGASVNDNLKRDTTHVIFKDGRLSTFKKAKSLGIPIVSILWIEACKNQRRICDPKDYQISSLDRYENPELYGKMKRHKFIQPGSEDKIRRSKKQAIEPTPPKSNKSQTDIGRFFKVLDKTVSKTGNSVVTPIRSNLANESPATILLNRYTSNQITPIASVNKAKSKVRNLVKTTPITLQSLHQFFDTPSANKQRRHTLFPLANSIRDINENSNEKQSTMGRQNEESDSVQMIVPSAAPVEITASGTTETPDQTSLRRRRTLFTPQSMVECKRVNENASAAITPVSSSTATAVDETIVEEVPMLTTPTYHASEDANIASAPISSARHMCRRRTVFDLSMDIISHHVQHINAKSRQSLAMTPLASTTTPESHNKSNNENANECNMTPGNKIETPIVQKDVPNEGSTTVEKKKRKLYRPLEFSPFTTPPVTPSKSSLYLATSINSKMQKSSIKRRRTLMPTVTNAIVGDGAPSLALSASKITPKSSLHSCRGSLNLTPQLNSRVERIKPKTKKAPLAPLAIDSSKTFIENDVNVNNSQQSVDQAKRRLPFLAFTNMRAEQVAVINEAVTKLGGFIERNVGPNTTHMVSLEARRTMNLLRSLILGIWMLDYNWIVDSLKAGHWLKEEQYEMKDFSRAVEICRAERQAFGQNYKCELFADLGAFYISPRCHNMPARDLKELICMCGGTVVDERKKSKYVLSSSTRAADSKTYVTPLWILDSITIMQLLRVQKYTSAMMPAEHVPSNTRNMPTVVDVVKE